jgi:hypothetical protein
MTIISLFNVRGLLIYMTVGRQHNERSNTLTTPKRRRKTSGTYADILPDLRVIQYTYPLIEASRVIHHVTSLDDRRRYARVQSFPNTNTGGVTFISLNRNRVYWRPEDVFYRE